MPWPESWIYKALAHGPATTPELAAERGTTVRLMNAIMHAYKRRGIVRRNGRVKVVPGRRGGPEKFWELTNARR